MSLLTCVGTKEASKHPFVALYVQIRIWENHEPHGGDHGE